MSLPFHISFLNNSFIRFDNLKKIGRNRGASYFNLQYIHIISHPHHPINIYTSMLAFTKPYLSKMFSTRTKSKSSSPLSPPWTELPGDLTENILQRLYTEEILTSVQLVCSTWWRVCKNPAMWRVINLDIRRRQASCNFGTICSCEAHEAVCFGDCAVDKCEVLCRCVVDQFLEIGRCAVDRSQGQLVDLKLAGFDVHELLNYVVQRHCQLRCLTLVEYQSCDELQTTPLTVQLIKLRQLEELHLYTKSWVDPKDFETIGIACPMLKSFTYHNCFIRGPDFVDYAAAIGKTMPNLHHLRLCQNLTGNKGLEPILDGCPNLNSFNLRQCSGFDKRGDLGNRCSENDRCSVLTLLFH